MRATFTISLPLSLRKQLDHVVKKDHLNRSDLVREALRQYLARREFRQLRKVMVPLAEAKNLFTDEDVFNRIS